LHERRPGRRAEKAARIVVRFNGLTDNQDLPQGTRLQATLARPRYSGKSFTHEILVSLVAPRDHLVTLVSASDFSTDVPVLARKPGALRNGAPFKDWVLPAGLERVRRKLASVSDGDRQMVDILAAVLVDGLPAVEAACGEALGQGVHSADVILNILARRRDVAAPTTILTPAALRLRHTPAADCDRYDRLRRPPWNAHTSST
jgi:hypothetical protein